MAAALDRTIKLGKCRTLPAADAHPRGHVFLHSRDYRHAGIEGDEEHDSTAMKAPNITCDSICQFASSFSSMDRISFVASVDIGTVPFLRVLLTVFGG